MRSSTGAWVTGDDFVGRERELEVLGSRVRSFNHVLLTGQRRMGKTSIARELGRRLCGENWQFIFIDVEEAATVEDVIALLASGMRQVVPLGTRWKKLLGQAWTTIEEVELYDFAVRFRAQVHSGNWKTVGQELIGFGARHNQPVLLVIDEMPVFLQRLRRHHDGIEQVDGFLSWLRSTVQQVPRDSLSLMVTGSIGLMPLVSRLGLPDRVNYLYPYRLGPWDRATSIECFNSLARDESIRVEPGVAQAVYDRLGIGIPYHVQLFFARLADHARMHDGHVVTVDDVKTVYRQQLLGPEGQSGLLHYETRLRQVLDEETDHAIAMTILAETARQDTFASEARRQVVARFSKLVSDANERVDAILNILEHDGYLERDVDRRLFFFPSRWLGDYWRIRYGATRSLQTG